jgi:tRNA(fMet)-specific endonuclease VapC
VKALLQSGEFLFTTRVNVAELLVGAHLSADPGIERTRISRLLRPMVILEFDQRSAEQFAMIKAHTLRHGRPVGDADMLIAAIAQVNNCTLLTRNSRHFQGVTGLKVESY